MPRPGLTVVSEPRRLTVDLPARGGAMAVLDWGDLDRPVDLVFAHANGFNALTYRHLLAPLADRYRIWAPDLRGHGATTLPTATEGRRGWNDHGADLAALLDATDGPPMVLAGHSMGGTAGLLAAAARPERMRGLVLADPVIMTRQAVLAFHLPLLRDLPRRSPLVVNALKRRSEFDSRAAALAAYRGRGAFKGWPDAVLADYLADGLVPAPDGGLTLACTSQWEASNYAAQAHDPWRAMRRLTCPIHILKAEAGLACHVPQPPRGLPHVTVETLPGSTHFLPMLQPDVVRDALRAMLEAADAA
ncbi:MAG: alpha/beta hydrolase [Caulobacterales bacterium]|nr:alpha/beta hydrolase [Caulobacterales bacterium]